MKKSDETPAVRTSEAQQGLVVFAKNKDVVSLFYQQTLSLSVEESESSHDLLRGNGYEIVVHAIPPKYASQIEIARPPKLREDTALKPTFVVADLDAVRVAVTATGGSLRGAESAWHIRGCIVLDGSDPEGNIVQFKQPVA